MAGPRQNLNGCRGASNKRLSIRKLSAAEALLVEGGFARVMQRARGGTHAPYVVNPWYNESYAQFAARTGAPL